MPRAHLLRLVLLLAAVAAGATLFVSREAGLVAAASTIVIFLSYLATPRGDVERSEHVATKAAGDDQRRSEASIPLDALGDPALVIAPNYRVLATNAPAIELFGERLLGNDLRLVARHPGLLDAVRLALAGYGPIVRELTALGQREGAYRVRAAACRDGRIFVGLLDVTQARLTERMRVDFVANASHELRTPLATILGFIETLQGPASDDPPARARFLDIMQREAARMARLIDDLLSLSRIELDKHVRPQSVIELPPLFADVQRTLAMRLEADGRSIESDVDPGLPPVLGDRDQLLQVLHNLLSNALKYGRTGTPIRLHARTEGDAVHVSISDEGDGIAPEHLPRLTERFYRVDSGRSRKMGGTGLGLAIVKHIIERHRGQLEIASVQGEGTRVVFSIPAARAQPTPRLRQDALS